MNKESEHNTSLFEYGDAISIVLSFGCILHCVALPVIALSSPLMLHFIENEWIHMGLFAVLTPMALLMFINGQKHHSDPRPLYWGVVGVAFLFVAILIGHGHGGHSHSEGMHVFNEASLTTLGSIALCAGHFFNIRLKKKCSCLQH